MDLICVADELHSVSQLIHCEVRIAVEEAIGHPHEVVDVKVGSHSCVEVANWSIVPVITNDVENFNQALLLHLNHVLLRAENAFSG